MSNLFIALFFIIQDNYSEKPIIEKNPVIERYGMDSLKKVYVEYDENEITDLLDDTIVVPSGMVRVNILFNSLTWLQSNTSYSVILSIFDNDKNINEINIKDKLIIIKVVTLLWIRVDFSPGFLYKI